MKAMVAISGTTQKRRVVVVHKPGPERLKQLLAQLKRLSIDPILLETVKDSGETQRQILKVVRPNDLILGFGGDGTANTIGNALLNTKELSSVVFVPLKGGNANDLAHMLNGQSTIESIFKTGRLMRCCPLEITVVPPDNRAVTSYALAYMGIGASANAAHRFSTIHKRAQDLKKFGLAFIYEAFTTWHAMSTSKSFLLSCAGEEPIVTSSLGFLRGDRVAKYGKARANLKATMFEVTFTRSLHYLSMLRFLIQFTQQKHPGALQSEPFVAIISTKDGAPILAHWDGEPGEISSDSQITVSVSKRSYTTLTTRL